MTMSLVPLPPKAVWPNMSAWSVEKIWRATRQAATLRPRAHECVMPSAVAAGRHRGAGGHRGCVTLPCVLRSHDEPHREADIGPQRIYIQGGDE